jgi:hypothetical protein
MMGSEVAGLARNSIPEPILSSGGWFFWIIQTALSIPQEEA